MLAVVIPTIEGREQYLERTLDQFESTVKDDYMIVTTSGHDCVGKGWNAGARQLADDQWDYILFCADDLEPIAGWYEAGQAALRQLYLPSATIWDAQGLCHRGKEHASQGEIVDYGTVPFMHRELWEGIRPFPGWHYYTDNWWSYACRKLGWETKECHEFQFLHRTAPRSRDWEVARMDQDKAAFDEWVHNGMPSLRA